MVIFMGEGRFSYLDNLPEAELKRKLIEAVEDLESSQEMIEEGNIRGEEITELRNDIRADRELINYLRDVLGVSLDSEQEKENKKG